MKTVDFFFDLSSPYSYLASTQLDGVAKRTGAGFRFRPMVLAAVFKAANNVMPAASPPKAKWMLADIARWSEEYGVPFQMSSHFPANTIKAMRLVIAADGKGADVAHAAFRAMWVDDRDLTADAELRKIAQSCGLDADRTLAQIETQPVKDQLRANTEDAVKHGVFGAPTLVYGDQLFWGNDRLGHLERALAR